MKRSTPPDAQADSGAEKSESVSLGDAAAGVFATTRRHLAQLLTLLTLEARYSGLMLGMSIMMAVISALAAFSAWGLALAAALTTLRALGWSWSAALSTLVLANGILMVVALWLMRRALARIGLESTRRALGLDLPNDAD